MASNNKRKSGQGVVATEKQLLQFRRAVSKLTDAELASEWDREWKRRQQLKDNRSSTGVAASSSVTAASDILAVPVMNSASNDSNKRRKTQVAAAPSARVATTQQNNRPNSFTPPAAIQVGLSLPPHRATQKNPSSIQPSSKKPSFDELKWNRNYTRLVAFHEQHKHCKVPGGKGGDGSFYFWLRTQKTKWTAGTLQPDRVEKLIALDIGDKDGPFKTNRSEDAWEKKYQELMRFKQEHGHCNASKLIGGKHLANWVCSQRQHYANRQRKASGNLDSRRRVCLTDEHMQRLTSLGFVFKVNTDFDDRLAQMYTFKAHYGHTRVPVAYREQNNLGRWVTSIKTAYYLGKVSKDRVDKLDAIGFDWSLRNQNDNNDE